MIQTKFGIPSVAGRQMEAYTTAVLEASLAPPAPAKHPEWRALMEAAARLSCEEYRSVRPLCKARSSRCGRVGAGVKSCGKHGLPGAAIIDRAAAHRGCCARPGAHLPATCAHLWRHGRAQVVHSSPQFVSYFRKATPEQELKLLNIGSRPAARPGQQGIASLRAIPWIFAWTQNRTVSRGCVADVQRGLAWLRNMCVRDVGRAHGLQRLGA